MQDEVTQAALIVTDADREAYLSLNTLPAKYRDAVMAGEWDKTTGVQAFARHRHQAEQRCGEVVAWMYYAEDGQEATAPLKNRLVPNTMGWTETPLYAHPTPKADAMREADRNTDTRGYIVGNGDRTKWRKWVNGDCTWTDDPREATRFFFRSDANAVHHEDEEAWCIIELRTALGETA